MWEWYTFDIDTDIDIDWHKHLKIGSIQHLNAKLRIEGHRLSLDAVAKGPSIEEDSVC